MQVHYGEGVAIHIGPEPCVGTREGDDEASVGERTGQPLNCVTKIVPSADVVRRTEGNMDGEPLSLARAHRLVSLNNSWCDVQNLKNIRRLVSALHGIHGDDI